MTKRARLEIFNEPLIYRDVLSIISKHCDTQTWSRLKQSCKLFNIVLLQPSISIPSSFKPLLRRLLYQLDKIEKRFNLLGYLMDLKTSPLPKINFYVNFSVPPFTIYSFDGSIDYLFDKPGAIFGNIYNDPIETIIQRYIKRQHR